MPKRSDHLLLEDIIENAEYIFNFTRDDTFESFIADTMKLYAVTRAFEIIGEAARSVSEETKTKYADIEWRQMSDFRNVLTHNYFGVENKIIWSVITDNLPYNYSRHKEIRW